jgi:mRNA-degrading endonuclease RelE of RelBE toxin-antitoxin system
MTWAVELSEAAEKDLKRLPRDRQALISRAIDRMEQDPFAGNVKSLKGPQWEGRCRRRVGNYRIIFTVDHQARRVEISAILIRSKKTYR